MFLLPYESVEIIRLKIVGKTITETERSESQMTL